MMPLYSVIVLLICINDVGISAEYNADKSHSQKAQFLFDRRNELTAVNQKLKN